MLNSSFFVSNWGSDVESALLKRCPPATTKWRGRLRCCWCFEGGEMGVFSTLHEIPLPKVVSTSPLFGQGRVMHSAEM